MLCETCLLILSSPEKFGRITPGLSLSSKIELSLDGRYLHQLMMRADRLKLCRLEDRTTAIKSRIVGHGFNLHQVGIGGRSLQSLYRN